MKPIVLAAACGVALSACMSTPPARTAAPAAPAAAQTSAATAPQAPATSAVTVGAFADGPALSVDDALARSSSLDGQTVRVAGTIRQVCQAKGCWLTFSTAQGQTLRVMTHEEGGDEDDSMVFPKDAAGRRAEVVGTLRVTEESVARRRHLAEDAGASAEEVAAITEPSRAVSLLATGARISM